MVCWSRQLLGMRSRASQPD